MGKVGIALYDVNNYQESTLPTAVADLISNFSEAQIDGIQSQLASGQVSASGFASYLQQLAISYVNNVVFADNPLSSNNNLRLSLAEIIRQLKAASETVQGYTLASGYSAGNASMNGNGAVAQCLLNSAGYPLDTLFAENIRLICTADATSNTNLARNEQFQALGQAANSLGVLGGDYPGGSTCNVSLASVDAGSDNTKGNLLTNSDFETWATSAATGWTISTGAWGTNALQSTAQHYLGASSLKIVGGATTTTINQTFNSSSGTLGTLLPQTVYAFAVWVKVDVVPAGGLLKFILTDGSGTTTTDVAGNNNSFSVTCSGLTTSWTVYTFCFRTPYIQPASGYKLRIQIATSLTVGSNLFIDNLGMCRATQLYAGGPAIGLFSGSSQWYAPDFLVLGPSNSRPSNNKAFVTLFERLFSMRQLGLNLPSTTGTPTYADSLIA